MSNGLKIVTIGGGSSYTPELIEGFIKRADILPVRELWLVDIEEGREKLEIIGGLARRMVKKAGLDIKIMTTLDRREALVDADFVTTQLRVGLLHARAKDELIPIKHNVIGQETNGPGGLFKALRTVPVILDIIKDCEELCPNAWIVSFTNPSGIVAQAVHEYTNWSRFVGLCNIPVGMVNDIAKILDVPASELRVDFAGLNHMVFGLRTYHNGVDVSAKVLERLIEMSKGNEAGIQSLPYSLEFIEELGCVPCAYLRYYYRHEEMRREAIAAAADGKSRAQVVLELEKALFEKYRCEELNVKPPELEQRGGAFYSDCACNLIASIYNDTCDIQVVNTPNCGAIDGLRNDVVEVSSVITKQGPRPITMGRLPLVAEGIVQEIKTFERLAAKAAVTGSYSAALAALTVNPFVRDECLARTILDEMLEAHKDYLPRFFGANS